MKNQAQWKQVDKLMDKHRMVYVSAKIGTFKTTYAVNTAVNAFDNGASVLLVSPTYQLRQLVFDAVSPQLYALPFPRNAVKYHNHTFTHHATPSKVLKLGVGYTMRDFNVGYEWDLVIIDGLYGCARSRGFETFKADLLYILHVKTQLLVLAEAEHEHKGMRLTTPDMAYLTIT